MYDSLVIRSAIIFGLLFQSLVMLCCGRWMNVPGLAATERAPAACCEPVPEETDNCCCCSDDGVVPTPPAHNGDSALQCDQICTRACDCGLTTDSPRVPGKPQRETSVEQLRASFATLGTPIVLPPLAEVLKPTIVLEWAGPPHEYGRHACERFCRWTI